MTRCWMKMLFITFFMTAITGCATEQKQVHFACEKSEVQVPSQQMPPANQEFTFKTNMDKMCYSYGVEIARGLMRQGVDFNPEAIYQGMKDPINGKNLMMDDEQIRISLAAFQNEVRARQARSRLISQQDNRKAGEEFLAQNKTKEGVITLPSGLQYKILNEGRNGPNPKDSDIVECYYRGTFTDGDEFDSSSKNDSTGFPSEFKVSDVIPGWREALKMMTVGSKWRLFIPSDLAYGQRGTSKIGPYTALIFDVELVGIKATE